MNAISEEHVVAVRTVYSVCRSLDSLLEKTLGPNGKSTLLNAPTGQVLITNVGCTVLSCMNIGHPLGTMIVNSIATHHYYTGDGSKTFMLYLASILGSIANSAEECSSIHESEQRNSLLRAVHYIRSQLFSNVLLPALLRSCRVVNLCEDKNATLTAMRNLAKSHLCGKYTEAIRSHLSHLLIDFLCSGVTDFRCLSAEVIACIDNFNMLCIDVDCMLPLSSYIHEGIVIQRDFLKYHRFAAECGCVRFVLLHNSFAKSSGKSELSSTFEAKDKSSIDKAFSWKQECSTALVNWLQKNGVHLILSAGGIDDTLHIPCAKECISMVQFVDKEDFERIKILFNIAAIEFMSDLYEVETDDFVGCTEVCESKVFGQKQFVCLKVPDRDRKCIKHGCLQTPRDTGDGLLAAGKFHAKRECLKRQLVICGMSAGACQQICLDLLHTLKTLRLWLDCKCLSTEESHSSAVHIAGGATFELVCYNALHDFLKLNALHLDTQLTVCCEALCTALLAVPLRLLLNSFQPKLSTVLYVTETVKSSANIRGFDGHSGHQLPADTTITEPLMSKILVLDHVLQLTEQLLRLHSLLHVKKLVPKDGNVVES